MTDYTVADTIHFLFTTRKFSTGAPFALASGVISAYENEGLTQITAGITLGVDHDSVAGLNLITVVASGANGFEAGKDYHLVITAGTVDSVSVVGEVVGRFTLSRSAAAVDLANGTDGLGAIKTDTAAILVDTGTTLDGRIPAALTGGKMESNIGSVTAGVIAAASFAAAALDAVWSTATRILTAGTNIVLAKGTGVTGLNDLSAAQVNAEADTALADYDAPTKAELDAAVAPLATAANLAVVAGYLDTEIAAILAKVTNLPSDPADASDIAASFASLASTLSTISGYIDTEVAAIKAKTDLIPGTTDGLSLAEKMTLISAVLLGKASGMATATGIFRAADDSKDRVTATQDADGNRTAITLDAA